MLAQNRFITCLRLQVIYKKELFRQLKIVEMALKDKFITIQLNQKNSLILTNQGTRASAFLNEFQTKA